MNKFGTQIFESNFESNFPSHNLNKFLVQLDSASEESDVTCRYIIEGCSMLSNRWRLVKDIKQPSLGVSWIQGQNSGKKNF